MKMIATTMNESNPYRAAGTYGGLSYINRMADEKLFKAILENHRYPYCLAPRQSGKSSLLANIAKKLNGDFQSIFIDLSVISPKALNDFDEFLSFLALKFKSSLAFTRTRNFAELSDLINTLIQNTEKRFVVFIDEIDILLQSSFKDQFFAQVRSVFNERSRNTSLMKVQFVLAGAAQPTQLISTVNMSPFNVGIQIELENLTNEQVIAATSHLMFKTSFDQVEIGNKIFHYTNGSVYLTQLTLEKLWEERGKSSFKEITATQVDYVINHIIGEANNNVHFINIYNQLLNDERLMYKFNQFSKGEEIDFPSLNALKMIGITDGINPYRNLIYKKVFDSDENASLSVNNLILSAQFDKIRSSKVFFNLPFNSKGAAFIGRKDKIEEIWNSLNKRGFSSIGKGISINGFGGLGKTQLAVEYAHKYRDKYENGIYWLTADEDIDIQLIRIGEELSWISQSDKGFDQAEFVRNQFRKLSNCLIIFDNVNDQKEIEIYLPEINFHPHILVTSRHEQYGFQPINLDTLSFDESRELITQIADRFPEKETEKKALDNILYELDGLPLAIELVGGYLLRRKNISFYDYYEYLNNESIEIIEKKLPENTFTNRDKSIIRALKISEKLFNDTKYLEDILDILAWSGKCSMSYSLLKELVGTTDNYSLKDALGVALELHFIKQEENNERYSIHPLLARVRQFEHSLAQRKEWHQKIINSLKNWFKSKDNEGKTLSEAEPEFEHLETWQKLTVEYLPSQAVWLTILKASPLIERGNYTEAEKYIKEAFTIYEQEGITDKTLLINLYIAISQINNSLGNYAYAKILIEKALNIYGENFINDKKILINLIEGLGSTYGYLGNYQNALELKQQALEMEEQLFDKKHPDIASSLSSIGSTYGALGEYQKALELQQQAFIIEQTFFGDTHSNIATSLDNIGLTYNHLGNLSQALELQQQALEIRQKLFGETHPDVATSLNNLGLTYSELGNHQKALEFEQQALEIRQKLFGKKHPDVATSLDNIGLTYNQLGNHKKALELEQRALQVRQELFGETHPDVATSLDNIGLTYNHLGNLSQALELQQQALEIRQKLFGETHPDIATSLDNIGLTYNHLGNLSQALELQQQALETRQKLFGEAHPDVATSLNNLAGTYYKLKNKEKASYFFNIALKMRREILGNIHPDTVTSCRSLILVLTEMGKMEVAGRLAAEFLSYIPQNHPDRKFFEKYGLKFRKKKNRNIKRHR